MTGPERPAAGAGARRELRVALLLVLAGAGLLLLAAGRHWVDVVVPQAAPLPPRAVVRSGGQVVGALSPLGLLGLAGLAALAATRALGRVLVGALLTAAGLAAAAVTVAALRDGALAGLDAATRSSLPPGTAEPSFTAWPAAALAGALLLAVGGLVVALRGRRWAALSGRYEAPAARGTIARRPARPEVEAWEALDRGEDPTSERDPREGPGGPAPSLGA